MEKTYLSSLVERGLSTWLIAEEIGCSQTNVRYWLRVHNLKTIRKTPRLCVECGSPLSKSKMYCSNRCQMDFEYKQRIADWLAGKIEGGNAHGVASWAKRWLIETRGEKCEKCGWSEVHSITGKVPIEAAHKNGWDDHRPEHLELLCPNCHSLTSDYRALNMGHGREYRRTGPRA